MPPMGHLIGVNIKWLGPIQSNVPKTHFALSGSFKFQKESIITPKKFCPKLSVRRTMGEFDREGEYCRCCREIGGAL